MTVNIRNTIKVRPHRSLVRPTNLSSSAKTRYLKFGTINLIAALHVRKDKTIGRRGNGLTCFEKGFVENREQSVLCLFRLARWPSSVYRLFGLLPVTRCFLQCNNGWSASLHLSWSSPTSMTRYIVFRCCTSLICCSFPLFFVRLL